jgi:hypothetical protein
VLKYDEKKFEDWAYDAIQENIQIHCLNRKIGCQEKLFFNELADHTAVCSFQSCCDHCKMLDSEMEQRLETGVKTPAWYQHGCCLSILSDKHLCPCKSVGEVKVKRETLDGHHQQHEREHVKQFVQNVNKLKRKLDTSWDDYKVVETRFSEETETSRRSVYKKNNSVYVEVENKKCVTL